MCESIKAFEDFLSEYENTAGLESGLIWQYRILELFAGLVHMCDNLSFFPHTSASEFSIFQGRKSENGSYEVYAVDKKHMETVFSIWTYYKGSEDQQLAKLHSLLIRMINLLEILLYHHLNVVPVFQELLGIAYKISFHFTYFMTFPSFEIAEIAAKFLIDNYNHIHFSDEESEGAFSCCENLKLFTTNCILGGVTPICKTLRFEACNAMDSDFLVPIESIVAENSGTGRSYLEDLKDYYGISTSELFHIYWHCILLDFELRSDEKKRLYYYLIDVYSVGLKLTSNVAIIDVDLIFKNLAEGVDFRILENIFCILSGLSSNLLLQSNFGGNLIMNTHLRWIRYATKMLINGGPGVLGECLVLFEKALKSYLNFVDIDSVSEVFQLLLKVLKAKSKVVAMLVPETLGFILTILHRPIFRAFFTEEVRQNLFKIILERIERDLQDENEDGTMHSKISVVECYTFIYVSFRDNLVGNQASFVNFMRECNLLQILVETTRIIGKKKDIFASKKLYSFSQLVFLLVEVSENNEYFMGFLKEIMKEISEMMTRIIRTGKIMADTEYFQHLLKTKFDQGRIFGTYLNPSFPMPSYLRAEGVAPVISSCFSIFREVSKSMVNFEEGRRGILELKAQLRKNVLLVGATSPYISISMLGSIFKDISTGSSELREFVAEVVSEMLHMRIQSAKDFVESGYATTEGSFDKVVEQYMLMLDVMYFMKYYLEDKEVMTEFMRKEVDSMVNFVGVPLYKKVINMSKWYGGQEWYKVERLLIARGNCIKVARDIYRTAIEMGIVFSYDIQYKCIDKITELIMGDHNFATLCDKNNESILFDLELVLQMNYIPEVPVFLASFYKNFVLNDSVVLLALYTYCDICDILVNVSEDIENIKKKEVSGIEMNIVSGTGKTEEHSSGGNMVYFLLNRICKTYSELYILFSTRYISWMISNNQVDEVLYVISEILKYLMSFESIIVLEHTNEILSVTLRSIPEAILELLIEKSADESLFLRSYFNLLFGKYSQGLERAFSNRPHLINKILLYIYNSGLRMLNKKYSDESSLKILLRFFSSFFEEKSTLNILTLTLESLKITINGFSQLNESIWLLLSSYRHLKEGILTPSDSPYVREVTLKDFMSYISDYSMIEKRKVSLRKKISFSDPVALYEELKDTIDRCEEWIKVLAIHVLMNFRYTEYFPMQDFVGIIKREILQTVVIDILKLLKKELQSLMIFDGDGFMLSSEETVRLCFWIKFVIFCSPKFVEIQEEFGELVIIILNLSIVLKDICGNICPEQDAVQLFVISTMNFIASLELFCPKEDLIFRGVVSEDQLKKIISEFVIPFFLKGNIASQCKTGSNLRIQSLLTLSEFLSDPGLTLYFIANHLADCFPIIAIGSGSLNEHFLCMVQSMGMGNPNADLQNDVLSVIQREGVRNQISGSITLPICKLIEKNYSLVMSKPMLFYETVMQNCTRDINWNIMFESEILADIGSSDDINFDFDGSVYFDKVLSELEILKKVGLRKYELQNAKLVQRMNEKVYNGYLRKLFDLTRFGPKFAKYIFNLDSSSPDMKFTMNCVAHMPKDKGYLLKTDYGKFILQPCADLGFLISNFDSTVIKRVVGKGKLLNFVSLSYFISSLVTYRRLERAETHQVKLLFDTSILKSRHIIDAFFNQNYNERSYIQLLATIVDEIKTISSALGAELQYDEERIYYLISLLLQCHILNYYITNPVKVIRKSALEVLKSINILSILLRLLGKLNLRSKAERSVGFVISIIKQKVLDSYGGAYAKEGAYASSSSSKIPETIYMATLEVIEHGIIRGSRNDTSGNYKSGKPALYKVKHLFQRVSDEPVVTRTQTGSFTILPPSRVRRGSETYLEVNPNELPSCETLPRDEMMKTGLFLLANSREKTKKQASLRLIMHISRNKENTRNMLFFLFLFLRRFLSEHNTSGKRGQHVIEKYRYSASIRPYLQFWALPNSDLTYEMKYLCLDHVMETLQLLRSMLDEVSPFTIEIEKFMADIAEDAMPQDASFKFWGSTSNLEVLLQLAGSPPIVKNKHAIDILYSIILKHLPNITDNYLRRINYSTFVTNILKSYDGHLLFSGKTMRGLDDILIKIAFVSQISLDEVMSVLLRKIETSVDTLFLMDPWAVFRSDKKHMSFSSVNSRIKSYIERGERIKGLYLKVKIFERLDDLNAMMIGKKKYIPRLEEILNKKKFNQKAWKIIESGTKTFEMDVYILRIILMVYADRYNSGKYRAGISKIRILSKQDSGELFQAQINMRIQNYLEKNFNLVNAYIASNPEALSDDFSSLMYVPKVLTFSNKEEYFYDKLKRELCNEKSVFDGMEFYLEIRRSSVLEDSMEQFLSIHSDDLIRGRVLIKFKGEAGIDLGGLEKEWLNLLVAELLAPEQKLFVKKQGYIYAINTIRCTERQSSDGLCEDSKMENDVGDMLIVKRLFFLLGRVLAYSIVRRIKLDVAFPSSFYKHILRYPITLDDLGELDMQLLNSMNWMLRNRIDDIHQIPAATEAFGASEGGDSAESMSLNKDEQLVSEGNKKQYIEGILVNHLVDACKIQIGELQNGFYDLVPLQYLEIFDYKNLELLVAGQPTIDVKDWELHTEYAGYDKDSTQIKWFWEIVKSISNEDRLNLVKFVTGSSRVPAEGFKGLRGMDGLMKFHIQRTYNTEELPTSHTCFNHLCLPEYREYEVLERNLLISIREGNGSFSAV